MTQGGDGDEPHRACTDHRNGVAVRDLRPECGVDTAGDRLHQDGEFIAHPVGDLVKLAGVGDELGRPCSTGRLTKAGLDAGLEITGGEMAVVVAVAGLRPLERKFETAGGMAEHRVEHDPAAVVGVADDLVAGNEREADEVFEVARRMTVDRRQVRTADAGEPGVGADPVRGRELGGVVVGQ